MRWSACKISANSHHPYSTERDFPAYLHAQNALIEGCVARGVPVLRVLHTDGPDTPDNPFAMASGFVVPLVGLTLFAAAATFIKHRHSALVGTVLDATLTFDMQQPDGQTLPAADIKVRTATVLAGRFATLRTVEQALAACAA